MDRALSCIKPYRPYLVWWANQLWWSFRLVSARTLIIVEKKKIVTKILHVSARLELLILNLQCFENCFEKFWKIMKEWKESGVEWKWQRIRIFKTFLGKGRWMYENNNKLIFMKCLKLNISLTLVPQNRKSLLNHF